MRKTQQDSCITDARLALSRIAAARIARGSVANAREQPATLPRAVSIPSTDASSWPHVKPHEHLEGVHTTGASIVDYRQTDGV